LSVWSDQLDDLLADPETGVDVVYTPKGGAPLPPIRAMVDRADDLLDVGGQQVERTSLLFTFRVADVPGQPQQGDRFEHAGRTWAVTGPASLDVEADGWTVRADRVRSR
jgi:hypothetical protein